MIVCQCAGVSDREILRLAQEGSSLDDITRRTGAGQCCSSCRDEVAALVGGAGRIPLPLARPAVADVG